MIYRAQRRSDNPGWGLEWLKLIERIFYFAFSVMGPTPEACSWMEDHVLCF